MVLCVNYRKKLLSDFKKIIRSEEICSEIGEPQPGKDGGIAAWKYGNSMRDEDHHTILSAITCTS
jgi:hypothetical protein